MTPMPLSLRASGFFRFASPPNGLFPLLLLLACLAAPAWADTTPPTPPCTVPAGSPYRYHVKNSCDKNVVLFFKAGVTGSVAAGQWCDAFGTYTDTLQAGVDFYYTPIASGATADFPVPIAGAASGSMVFAYDCPSGYDGATNDCAINFSPSIVHTAAEFTAGCGYGLVYDSSIPGYVPDPRCAANPSGTLLSAADNYDISAVAGFTLPMTYTVSNYDSTIFSCSPLHDSQPSVDASMLDMASCAMEYGYYGDAPQTLAMTKADKTAYATTYGILTNPAYASGISMAAEGTDANNNAIYTSCVSPCQWYSFPNLGNPGNPTPLVTNSPGEANTFDWYCCANLCGQNNCTDADTSCSCTCPGCRGAQCSKGVGGNYKTKAIQYTNYVKRLKEMGYQGYAWQYDDDQGDEQCGWQNDLSTDPSKLLNITLELCPNGGDPIQKSQKWAYDSGQGKCVVNNTSGTYGSYYDCITTDPVASTKFTIVADTVLGYPNSGIPNRTYNYCVWDGTATSGTMSYKECVAKAYPVALSVVPEIDLLLNN